MKHTPELPSPRAKTVCVRPLCSVQRWQVRISSAKVTSRSRRVASSSGAVRPSAALDAALAAATAGAGGGSAAPGRGGTGPDATVGARPGRAGAGRDAAGGGGALGLDVSAPVSIWDAISPTSSSRFGVASLGVGAKPARGAWANALVGAAPRVMAASGAWARAAGSAFVPNVFPTDGSGPGGVNAPVGCTAVTSLEASVATGRGAPRGNPQAPLAASTSRCARSARVNSASSSRASPCSDPLISARSGPASARRRAPPCSPCRRR